MTFATPLPFWLSMTVRESGMGESGVVDRVGHPPNATAAGPVTPGLNRNSLPARG